MPQIQIRSENKIRNASDFPKLKLVKNEHARIAIMEDPTVEFVHTLRAPVLDEDGKLVYEVRKSRKPGGEDTSVPKYDFVSRHLCFGTFEVVAADGADPKNCPTCKAAKESPAIAAAERRFAMNVVKYNCRPGSFTPMEPIQGQVVVWSFATPTYNQLVDFAAEWGDPEHPERGLRGKDLNLGPCTVEAFQRFDVQVANKTAWLQNGKTVQQAIASLYKDNKCEDLTAQCGRNAEKSFVLDDIRTCVNRYKKAYGTGADAEAAADALEREVPAADVPTEEEVDAAMDLDNLLGDEKVDPKADVSPETEKAVEDILAEAEGETETPVAEPPKPEETVPEEELDFDALLET
jgi:hypothetical protein